MADYCEIETIYGYDIKDLAVFAAACIQEGITESEMHDFCLNASAAYDFVMSEMGRVQKETIERITNWMPPQKPPVMEAKDDG